MSEEKNKRYTCANSLCPCMELAIIKEQQMKAKESSTGKSLGTVYYFTETEVEESGWDQSGYDECEHIEIVEAKGGGIKKVLIVLAAVAGVGAAVAGVTSIAGGAASDPQAEAQEIISGAIDPLFAK